MRKKTIGLTPRQGEILDFLISQINLKGYPPSVREIGEAIGLQSSSTVHSHLIQLEQKGYIRRDPSKPRAIVILKSNDSETPKLDLFEDNNSYDEMVNVPVIGTVAAGIPILAEQNVEDTVTLPMNFVQHDNSFILHVKGDSMVNVGIMDGDYIIVSPRKVATNGEIVVALMDNEATVKTFYREKNRIRLQPENDTMDPIYVTDVEIIGKVIGLFRRMH